MNLLSLSIKALGHRRGTMLLTASSIAMSVALFLAVQRVREAARSSFENTLSGTDLVVGARTSPIQLLLYAVFRMGNGTNDISWASYQHVARDPDVAWTIPISLGDSHRGYRVVGTTLEYFRHYRYGQEHPLAFAQGQAFQGPHDVVVGSEVAAALGYTLGTTLVLSHGVGEVSFTDHADQPFTIVGILARTSTPVDQSLHVSLEAIELIHAGWNKEPDRHGVPEQEVTHQGEHPDHDDGEEKGAIDQHDDRDHEAEHEEHGGKDGGVAADGHDHDHKHRSGSITAFFVGLKAKTAVLGVQREINTYAGEPLLAILPGVSFLELWRIVAVAEMALMVVSVFVVIGGLVGMLATILATLGERRREMAVLRSVGARPRDIFFLLVTESFVLGCGGCVLGTGLFYLALLLAGPILTRAFGLDLPLSMLGAREWMVLGVMGLSAAVVGVIPAAKAYRQSLADGLSMKV
jgi:putative ABC transport system permease protein